MSQPKSKKFKWKGFTSFFVTFSFVIMSLTGIILYFAPPGRIAHWSNWTFLSLTKEQWQAQHTIFSLAFLILAGFHLYFNWAVFVSYIKKRMQKGIHLKRELAWSFVFSIALWILTQANVPPFSTIMVWGEQLSNSWANEQTEPPIPHAEAFTLAKLAKTTQISIQEIMTKLKAQGIEPQSKEDVVGDLAKKYNLTPSQLFNKISVKVETEQSSTGRGYGQKTVEQICRETNIDVAEGLNRLKLKGIMGSAKDNVRKLAIDHQLRPIEIVEIIEGKTDSTLQH